MIDGHAKRRSVKFLDQMSLSDMHRYTPVNNGVICLAFCVDLIVYFTAVLFKLVTKETKDNWAAMLFTP
jgi:hypothetical protein